MTALREQFYGLTGSSAELSFPFLLS